MKYRRQNGKSPAYSRYYEPPPRFQKENHFHIPSNQNSPRVFYFNNSEKNFFIILIEI